MHVGMSLHCTACLARGPDETRWHRHAWNSKSVADVALSIPGRRKTVVGVVCLVLLRDSRSACRKGEKPPATMAWALSKGVTGDGGRLRPKETIN